MRKTSALEDKVRLMEFYQKTGLRMVLLIISIALWILPVVVSNLVFFDRPHMVTATMYTMESPPPSYAYIAKQLELLGWAYFVLVFDRFYMFFLNRFKDKLKKAKKVMI